MPVRPPLSHRVVLLAAVLLAPVATPAGAGAQTFTFDAPALLGQSTPLTLTSGGLTAVVTSPAGAAYVVDDTPGLFETFSGGYLVNQVAPAASPLVFSFSQTLGAVGFRFGTQDLDAPLSSVRLDAFLGATNVGSVAATGAFTPNGLYAVGELAFTAPAFDRIEVRSLGSGALALDALVARVAPSTVVPEPTTAPLVAGGLAAVGLAWRRRTRRGAAA